MRKFLKVGCLMVCSVLLSAAAVCADDRVRFSIPADESEQFDILVGAPAEVVQVQVKEANETVRLEVFGPNGVPVCRTSNFDRKDKAERFGCRTDVIEARDNQTFGTWRVKLTAMRRSGVAGVLTVRGAALQHRAATLVPGKVTGRIGKGFDFTLAAQETRKMTFAVAPPAGKVLVDVVGADETVRLEVFGPNGVPVCRTSNFDRKDKAERFGCRTDVIATRDNQTFGTWSVKLTAMRRSGVAGRVEIEVVPES